LHNVARCAIKPINYEAFVLDKLAQATDATTDIAPMIQHIQAAEAQKDSKFVQITVKIPKSLKERLELMLQTNESLKKLGAIYRNSLIGGLIHYVCDQFKVPTAEDLAQE
jgi:hypothetical protein